MHFESVCICNESGNEFPTYHIKPIILGILHLFQSFINSTWGKMTLWNNIVLEMTQDSFDQVQYPYFSPRFTQGSGTTPAEASPVRVQMHWQTSITAPSCGICGNTRYGGVALSYPNVMCKSSPSVGLLQMTHLSRLHASTTLYRFGHKNSNSAGNFVKLH